MQLDKFINEEISKGTTFPCIDILYAEGDEILLHKQWGDVRAGEKLAENSLFDMASLTKPIVIGTLLMILVKQKLVALEDKVKTYIPEFIGQYKSEITLGQLASHISGLPADYKFYMNFKELDEAYAHLFSMPLECKPASKMIYSCLGYMLLAEIIRRVTGKTLASSFYNEIASPLGMNDSLFNPAKTGHNAVPTSVNLQSIVHDGNARMFESESGNAGLFSTANDLYKYAKMLLNPDHPLNNPMFFKNQNPLSLTPRTIGWELKTSKNDDSSCGAGFAHGMIGSIGHTGFTGTSMWLNPQTKQVLIALSNRVYISHDANMPAMRTFRQNLHAHFG